MKKKWRFASAGFTLLELIVSFIIIMILTGVFLDRIRFYQNQAEKMAMAEVVEVIRISLIVQYGMVLARGQPGDLAALSRANPMDWLQIKPHNYSGEFYDPVLTGMDAGNWLFDLKSRELIYVVNNHAYFHATENDARWIRFHVVPVHDKKSAPVSSLPPDTVDHEWLVFEPVQPYSWF